MFFTPELLARRDSGIGLLWLAATLGSKSTLKKLQKRDVMTANISQLCELVAQPAEPLALRLSSNLMVGVARVYKVKQEIFMSDVTLCFNALKKVVEEFRSNGELQMAQSSARPATLTLANDLRTAFAMEFDNMIADWDEYLNVGAGKMLVDVDGDGDFDPNIKPNQKKQRKKPSSVAVPEEARADLYTLKENHENVFSSSFEASFNGIGGPDLSSSQPEAPFDFGDDFLGGLDNFDISADLARELGEGWGGSPTKVIKDTITDVDLPPELEEVDFGIGMDVDMNFGLDTGVHDPIPHHAMEDLPIDAPVTTQSLENDTLLRNQMDVEPEKENIPLLSPLGSANTARSALSPGSFARSFLLQGNSPGPENAEPETEIQKAIVRRHKRTRLLLDARTELTDEELKATRAQYLGLQSNLRRELKLKRSEKNSDNIINNLLWAVPTGIHAQVLIDFWLVNFKVQVEARSGAVNLYMNDANRDGPPAKRRKIKDGKDQDVAEPALGDNSYGVAMDVNAGHDVEADFFVGGYDNIDQDHGHLRSSEEPGQGRRESRPPSVLGSNFGSNLGLPDVPSGSQRLSLFPWDNAGASSSVGGAAPGPDGEGSDRISVERAESKVIRRENSLGRRESSLVPSQAGSAAGIGFSPMAFGRMSEEDFAFEIPENGPMPGESHQSDTNLVTLERNSYNFLEYAKMQYHSLPATSALTFDDIVPKITSSRHVAAAAFYHCLVLATKDLIRLQQPTAYGTFSITVV